MIPTKMGGRVVVKRSSGWWEAERSRQRGEGRRKWCGGAGRTRHPNVHEGWGGEERVCEVV